MKSVASKSSVSAACLSAAGCVVSSTSKLLRVEGALDHLGREARTAHPEQDEGVDDPGRGQILDELEQVADAAAHAHRLVEPAEPLRLVVAGPERRRRAPRCARPARRGRRRSLHRLEERRARARRTHVAARGWARARCPRSTRARAFGSSRSSRSAISCMSGTSSSPTRTSVGRVDLAEPLAPGRRTSGSSSAVVARRAAAARTRAAASRRRVPAPAGSTSSGAAAAGRRPRCAGSPRPPRRGRRASSAASSARPSAPSSPPTSRARAARRRRGRALERARGVRGRPRARRGRRARRRRAPRAPSPCCSSSVDQVTGVREAARLERRAAEAAQVVAQRPAVNARERLPLRVPHAAVADPFVDRARPPGPRRRPPTWRSEAATLRPRPARRAWPGRRRAAPRTSRRTSRRPPLERVDHVVVVDAGLGDSLEDAPRLVDILLERERDLAVILEGARSSPRGIVLTVSGPISSSTYMTSR